MSPSDDPSGYSRSEREASPPLLAQASSGRPPGQNAGNPSRKTQPPPPLARPSRRAISDVLPAAMMGAVVLGTAALMYMHYTASPTAGSGDQELAKCLPSLPVDAWAPRPQAWATTLERDDLLAGRDISPGYSRSYITTACGMFLSGGLHTIVRSVAEDQGQAELLEDVLASGPAGMMCYSFTGLYAGHPLRGTTVWYHGGLVKSTTGSAAVGEVSQWCHERMEF